MESIEGGFTPLPSASALRFNGRFPTERFRNMKPEDSALLRHAVNKVNEEIRKGFLSKQDRGETGKALLMAMDEAIGLSNELAPGDHKWFLTETTRRHRVRRKMMAKIRRTHLRRWGRGFILFDDALAASEVLNAAIEDTIGRWTLENEPSIKKEYLLGVKEILGGQARKCLLLLSLHSRACSIANEIRLLVEHGFPEAVKARTRSLHELAVIALALNVHGQADTSVSDRYGAWTLAEARKEARAIAARGGTPEPLDELEADLERRAAATWGGDFFRQNGWAAPLFPGRRPPIPFNEIEQRVNMEHMRDYYMAGNDAIHAGPSALMNRLRLRNGSVFPTVSEVQHETVRNFAAVAVMTLSDLGATACRAVASITQDFDLLCGIKVIRDFEDLAVSEFRNDGMRA
ncbi:hypothetical protein E3E14_24995 [Streptomyces sp. ICN441]|uniref:DUF5677 domain-containing protein n=1 Tax=Streptomyces sp. ICN441 TaxID=2558286 RepID=UPI00106B5793|nr:DUF5677 domain-containing protein [Streptomyces sp. ICN441]TFE42450.1 hypothetical protein E3E14_24995 [Streptomyces sp. ICN441]